MTKKTIDVTIPYEFRFERRRYRRFTYTWVQVKHGQEWLSLGDPWPCVVPKRTQLIEAARAAIQKANIP